MEKLRELLAKLRSEVPSEQPSISDFNDGRAIGMLDCIDRIQQILDMEITPQKFDASAWLKATFPNASQNALWDADNINIAERAYAAGLAALATSEPAPQLGQNNEYAAYANHCAIEHKIPQTFHTWKREQIRLAKNNE